MILQLQGTVKQCVEHIKKNYTNARTIVIMELDAIQPFGYVYKNNSFPVYLIGDRYKEKQVEYVDMPDNDGTFYLYLKE